MMKFRTITYHVPAQSSPIRISTFLRQQGYSRQNLIELKKHECSVTVDGRGRYFNERLFGEETVTVHIPLEDDPQAEAACLAFDMIYEDADLLVVNKPAGMPTHPSYNNRNNTLANALTWYFRQKEEPFVFRCSNRLDRDTSGLTVVAKHMVSGNILSVMGTHRKIHREYLGIVRGIPSPVSGTIDAPLSRVPGSVLMRQVDVDHGERAVTHYSVVASFRVTEDAPGHDTPALSSPDKTANTYSLLRLSLETGRTHQIRVHLKYIGSPLIGDYLYNPDFAQIHRQALHCARLSFPHPMTGQPLSFEAPLPEDMQRITPAGASPPPAPGSAALHPPSLPATRPHIHK